MATRNAQGRPGRALLALIILIGVLAGTLVFGVVKGKTDAAPDLALDLEGGTQLILTPKVNEEAGGDGNLDEEDLAQAIEIIRQRVDSSGVSEAEITSQGQRNIVVSLPGHPSEETLDLVRQSAELNFRSVLMAGAPGTQASQVAAAMTAQDENADVSAYSDAAAFAHEAADRNGDGTISDEPDTEPADNSDDAWITEAAIEQYMATDCTDPASREGGDSGDPAKPFVACAKDGSAKYLLGPVDLPGSMITAAQAGIRRTEQGQTTNEWEVALRFNSEGGEKFAEVSERLLKYRGSQTPSELTGQPESVKNQFAIVLDGVVVSAPGIEARIGNGSAEITGKFTRSEATTLANQLQFGSLPLNFEVQQEQQISATLGSDQLRWGLIAGVIGLVLIVFYMVWQYRGLAIISVGSLIVAAGLAYLVIALLSWWMGYRLSLAGVAGIIISIGTTADSFIVYFERIRDEVRDGRPLTVAVREGWRRASRTIITSDMVNILAALVLYFLAVSGVQGFAFTLGVMTAIDLVVIFLFTHPLMLLFMRIRFFGEGHRFSGLDPEHLGATRRTYAYAGRGQFRPARARQAAATARRGEAVATEEDAHEEKEADR